jgi:hypothetical protein
MKLTKLFSVLSWLTVLFFLPSQLIAQESRNLFSYDPPSLLEPALIRRGTLFAQATGEQKSGQGGTLSEVPKGAKSSKTKVEEETQTILVQSGGVLIPKGTLVIEPSVNYSHFSRNVISISGSIFYEAITVGQIQVEEIRRDIVNGMMTLRYGILDRLQFNVQVPYLYRHDQVVLPAGTGGSTLQPQTNIEGNGLGDIQGRIDIHAVKSRGWVPDIIFNVQEKSTTGKDPYGLESQSVQGVTLPKTLATGTGHYGVSGGFTLVKASDPVVFFSTVNYYWNFERNVGGSFGEIKPGSSIEYILGMAVALSERIAMNLSFQNVFTSSTKQNDIKLPGTDLNAANVLLGASYRLSKYVSLYTTAGIGLTRDSPDYQIQINLPITFSLF